MFMPTKFDEAFAKVQKLAAIFESGKDHYLSGDYQEADVRKDFIDKFFTALGWDVNHDEQTNPYAQEVKVERGVNEGSARKRADYAFFHKPNYRDVRFFVEAKRPSKDFGSADNCFQAIRYGHFTKKTSPFAVLTSFEDFYILDCRLKPNINSTLASIVERFSYTDYVDAEKFARIYWLFSREAVAGGSLEKFTASHPVAKGKKFQRGLFKGGDVEPDEAFLEELDGYRQKLAKAFKDANPDLDGETLTEVTQRTLDRLVFTRFLEDKGIEAPVIENFGKADGFWEDFVAASLRLDRKYNGVVFKFHPRLDAPGFKPDEKVFARICEELTDPTSDYNFNIIPIHILGSIYERFLGKVISDSARVVEKPEVRKAGGVYYTPEYIVRYIVENTVGKMIEGKTPEEISKLKFADIACGSGSFLLGVYDVLLKYHAEYYSKNPGKVRKGDCVRRDGTLHLSLQKKRDILTNNLFGVDIDRQAVEVAQLSLYLKLLEDETVGTTSEFQDEFHFTLLPSLDKNIVCGNSLIGPDIADGGKLTDEEEKKINPLDYAQRFPTIFRRRTSSSELHDAAPGDIEHNYPGGMPLHGSYTKGKKSKAASPRVPESEYEGGFDAIVGNPPYGDLASKNCEVYLETRYECETGIPDFYALFIARCLKLLKKNCPVGYIIPSAWLGGPAYQTFRSLCLNNSIAEIINLPFDVFEDAYVDTLILIVRAGKSEMENQTKTFSFPKKLKISLSDFQKAEFQTVSQHRWAATDGKKIVLDSGSLDLLEELRKRISTTFENYVQIKRGVLFKKELLTAKKSGVDSYPYFEGDVYRYEVNFNAPQWIEFNGQMDERPKEFKWFEGARLLLRRLVNRKQRLMASFADKTFITNKNLYSVLAIGNSVDVRFVLGVLNSRLVSKLYISQVSQATKDDFPQVTIKDVLALPFPQANKSRHDRLVELVEQMLAAKAKLPTAKTERDREFYTNKCATLDQQIDALVYELYGLTAEEIKLVEGAAK